MANPTDIFFGKTNETKLQRVLYTDICRRIGGDLSEKQASRLMNTVKHYMGEVYRVQGNGRSVTDLNKEVLAVTLPDYLKYLERQSRTSGRSVMSDMEEGPGQAAFNPEQQRGPVKQLEDTITVERRSQMDVTNAFSALQAQRQETKARAPQIPDFKSFQEEAPFSLDMFEKVKQERDSEARRAEVQIQRNTHAQQGINSFVEAGDTFLRDRRRADEEAEVALADRERQRLEARAASGNQLLTNPVSLPVPDMRSVLLGDKTNIGRTMNQSPMVPIVPMNTSAGNPTTALPLGVRESSAQQLIITREPESMNYKETELNLFAYSADRDWVSNSQETRYNFSVTFDPANLPTGLRLNPTSTVKFRNIVRIEIVKAIMPGENLDSLVTRTFTSPNFTYSGNYNINVLSFPYVQVRVPELDNNVYGTNQGLNAAFGVLQYDANWIYDTSITNQRGYFAMIPKFLKCQKEYKPTPLATLNKLTFRFERPDGSLISDIPDTLDIRQIYGSKSVAATTAFPYGYDSSVEANTGSAYYFIKTSTYFNLLSVSKGDRIIIKNLGWTTAPSSALQPSQSQLTDFLQEDAGLIVADVGFGTNASDIVTGGNKQGYCNFIIVRGKFTDPTLGGTTTSQLGGVNDTSAGSAAVNSFTEYLGNITLTKGRLLNSSHQVQVALRVITRELDSTGFLRPDNLY
jgi:hypothetical protein